MKFSFQRLNFFQIWIFIKLLQIGNKYDDYTEKEDYNGDLNADFTSIGDASEDDYFEDSEGYDDETTDGDYDEYSADYDEDNIPASHAVDRASPRHW